MPDIKKRAPHSILAIMLEVRRHNEITKSALILGKLGSVKIGLQKFRDDLVFVDLPAQFDEPGHDGLLIIAPTAKERNEIWNRDAKYQQRHHDNLHPDYLRERGVEDVDSTNDGGTYQELEPASICDLARHLIRDHD